MSVYEKMLKIQQDTKCGKSQYNKFGDFNFRNIEDIWEAVKPVAASYGAVLTCDDEIKQIGDRFYVKATATIIDVEKGESYSVHAYAREAETKTKMDAAQLTGMSSSYARKYAMGGLLGLDDTRDADGGQNADQLIGSAQPAQKPAAQTPQTPPTQTTQPGTSEQPKPQAEQHQSDRTINIKSCIMMAEKQGRAALINENGYRGKPWDKLTDDEVIKIKLWLVSSGKKAGAA